jgi:hypothetical protein
MQHQLIVIPYRTGKYLAKARLATLPSSILKLMLKTEGCRAAPSRLRLTKSRLPRVARAR